MNEIHNSPTCERASDLIAFLYDEATAQEKRGFELHLQACSSCREEAASFGLVRESITAWRDEALSGFVATPLPAAASKKSAITAIRQFFDLSPLWLKGATAFALLTFCVLAFAIVSSVETNPGTPNTNERVKRMVQEPLARQLNVNQPAEDTSTPTTVESPKPKVITSPSPAAKSRRPLTRAEREQLAADLRLLSTPDDADLDLLGDRIKQ